MMFSCMILAWGEGMLARAELAAAAVWLNLAELGS